MKLYSFIALIVAALAFASCGSRKAQSDDVPSTPIAMRHARNIRIDSVSPDLTIVTLRNPWDSTRNLARYALVNRNASSKPAVPADAKVIEVPLQRAVVYSGVHISLLNELGSGEAVVGLCDAEYLSDPAIAEAVKSGKIADCGKNTNPNMEKIVSLRPDAIMLSPFENGDDEARFARTGIKVIQTADYLESTPLARAEWMRFYGRLYGKNAQADSLFHEVENRYEALRTKAAGTATKPNVLIDRIYGGVWNVPTSGSATGHLIADAGGVNPFSDYSQAGSAHLAPEKVLHKAQNVDVWLVRYTEPSLSLRAMATDNKLYTNIAAFKNGNVYGCNTLTHPIFDDIAFHPDLVLGDMVTIFHPELSDSVPLRYYELLK